VTGSGPPGGSSPVRGHVGQHVIPSRARHGRLVVTRDELVAWGEGVGRAAHPPMIMAISGPLGAGKTTLVQAVCRGYGVTMPVTSPTFALVHEYRAPRSPVFHLDLFRLAGPAELTAIGWDEIVAAHALVLVEWPERAGDRLPSGHVPIDLEYVAGDDTRRMLLAG
jgi:tRNA threonylcarbamoyladenosine biosynthesis protein TsaE